MLDRAAMGTISSAERFSSDYLVTFGIVATFPHTGMVILKPQRCGSDYRVQNEEILLGLISV